MVFTTLKDSIKHQSNGILVGKQKKGGSKLGDFPSSQSQLCLNIEKKLVLHELRIYYFFLFYWFWPWRVLEIWFQSPRVFPGNHLLHFSDQEIEAQRGEWHYGRLLCWQEVCRMWTQERHSCCFLFRKVSQADQHLEHSVWNVFYSYREFHERVRVTCIQRIIDHLWPCCFICCA